MADILRQPLVSQRQQKRPIPPVDYFSRPLTLVPAPPATLDLPLRSGRLFDSAPRKRWQPDSLQSQGLIVYDGPEAAIGLLTDSAPQAKRRLSLEQPSNLLTSTLAQSGLGLPLLAVELSASAPWRVRWINVESQVSSLALGDIAMPLLSARLDASAPRGSRVACSVDVPNLLGNTLAPPLAAFSLPLSAIRIDVSAPSIKYQVRTEALYRPLTLGINPNAAVASITDSATPAKKASYGFDPPNLVATTLADPLGLPLIAGRVDASAPSLKYQVRVENLYRPVTLGFNPNPLIAQISDSAASPKRVAYGFDPPNLIATTLAEKLDLPRLAVRMSWSAPQPKRCAYLDVLPNTLLMQPPPSVQVGGIRYIRVQANSIRIRANSSNRRIKAKPQT